MRRSAALGLLAPAHGRALELSAAGLDPAAIAAELAVDPTAVGPLLRVAEAKLAALEAMDDNDDREEA